MTRERVARPTGTVMPATPDQTVICLGLRTGTDEWWIYREPVIGWLLTYGPDGDWAELKPLLWQGDSFSAMEPWAAETNAVYLYGLYRADEVPDAEELCAAATRVRRQLVNLERRASASA